MWSISSQIHSNTHDALKWQKSNIVELFKTLVMGKWFSLSRLKFISHLHFKRSNVMAKPNGLFDTLSPNPLQKSNKTKTKEILRMGIGRSVQWAVYSKWINHLILWNSSEHLIQQTCSHCAFQSRFHSFACHQSHFRIDGSNGRGKLFWLLNN